MGFGLGSGGGGLVAILSSVSFSTTEHTQVVIEVALLFLLGELAVFSELIGKGGGATGGRGGLPRFVLPRGLVVVLLELPEPDAGVLLLSLDLFLPSDLFFPAWDFSRLCSQ